MGVFELLQCHIDQELEFEHGELSPYRVFIEFNADQCGDVAVLVELVVLGRSSKS